MIPYTACMCFNKRGRPWTVVKSQRGTGVRLRVEDGWLAIKVAEKPKDESNVSSSTKMRSKPAGITRSEWSLLEALAVAEDAPKRTSRFQTPQRRRNRARIPVMKPQALKSGLLDDSYNGIVKCMLGDSHLWDFNTFHLDVVTGGRSLSVLLFHLFQYYGFIETFSLDVVKLWKCFNLIESCYHRGNPYHNSVHAADVTQAMHCFLQEKKICSNMTPVELMSALLAAVTHDLDHPGVNQPFLIATSNHLASLYKNFSVLENHHWRMAISCLRECGIFDHLDVEIWNKIEDYIHSLILATDITRQQEFLSKFKRFLEGGMLKLEDPTYRHFILQIALKCADLCNPCRPWLISQRWSHQVCLEFFKQGDYEKKLKLPLTPICDRSRTSIAKIQADFFRFVVTPLFEIWDGFLASPLSQQLLGNLRYNQICWDGKVAALEPVLPREEVEEEKCQECDSTETCVDGCGTPVEQSRSSSGSWVLRATVEDDCAISLWSRRCSMPLSIPKLLPRTVIRRQSFPYAHGANTPDFLSYPIHRSPHMSLRTLSSEQLQPKTSIISLSSSTATAVSLLGMFSMAEESERKLVHQPMSYPPFTANRTARETDLMLLEEPDCLDTPSDETRSLLLVDSPDTRRRKSGSSESDCSNGGCSGTGTQPSTNAQVCVVNSQEQSGAQTIGSGDNSTDPPSDADPTNADSNAINDAQDGLSNQKAPRSKKHPLLRTAPIVLDPSMSPPCHKSTSNPESIMPSEIIEKEAYPPGSPLFKEVSSWCSQVSRSLSEERPEPPSRDFDSPAPSWKSSSSSLSSGSRLAHRRGSAPVASTGNQIGDPLVNGSSNGYRRRWSMATEAVNELRLDLDEITSDLTPPFSIHPLGKELVRRHSFGILESLVGFTSSESENDGSSTDPTSTGTTCSTRRNSTITRQGSAHPRYDSRCTSIDQEGSCSSESHDTFPSCLQPSRHILNRRRGSLPTDIPISLANRIPFSSSGYSGVSSNAAGNKSDTSTWDSGFLKGRSSRENQRRRASAGEILGVLVGPAMTALQEIATRSPSPEQEADSKSACDTFLMGLPRRGSGGGLELLSGLWRSRTIDSGSQPTLYAHLSKQRNFACGMDPLEQVDTWLSFSRLRGPLLGSTGANLFGSFNERNACQQRRSSVPVDLALFTCSSE